MEISFRHIRTAVILTSGILLVEHYFYFQYHYSLVLNNGQVVCAWFALIPTWVWSIFADLTKFATTEKASTLTPSVAGFLFIVLSIFIHAENTRLLQSPDLFEATGFDQQGYFLHFYFKEDSTFVLEQRFDNTSEHYFGSYKRCGTQLKLDHNPIPEVLKSQHFIIYPDANVGKSNFGKMNFFEVDKLGMKRERFVFSVRDASALYQ